MAPTDLLADLLECTWRVDVAAVWDAAKYVIEYRLFYWLVWLNCDKGVAPDNLSIYKAAASFVPREVPAGMKAQLRHYFLAADRTARYWVESFRNRWGAFVGKLRQGSLLEQEEFERKDAWACYFRGPGFSGILRFFFCALGAENFAKKLQFRGPKTGPFFGPVFGSRYRRFNRILING